jgi:hypothetical protein
MYFYAFCLFFSVYKLGFPVSVHTLAVPANESKTYLDHSSFLFEPFNMIIFPLLISRAWGGPTYVRLPVFQHGNLNVIFIDKLSYDVHTYIILYSN